MQLVARSRCDIDGVANSAAPMPRAQITEPACQLQIYRTLKVARSSFVRQRLASPVASPHAHPCAGPHGLNNALPLRPVLAGSPRHFAVGSPGGAFLAMCAAISRRRLAVVIGCQP